jgi:hypothetical protein
MAELVAGAYVGLITWWRCHNHASNNYHLSCTELRRMLMKYFQHVPPITSKTTCFMKKGTETSHYWNRECLSGIFCWFSNDKTVDFRVYKKIFLLRYICYVCFVPYINKSPMGTLCLEQSHGARA